MGNSPDKESTYDIEIKEKDLEKILTRIVKYLYLFLRII